MRNAFFAATLAVTISACGGTPREELPSSGALAPVADATTTKPTPRYPHLDSALNAVLASDRPLESAAERGLRVQEERIQVTISTAPEEVEVLVAWLAEHGAHNVSSAGGEVQADVSVEHLRALDARPEVLRVRQPSAIRDPGVR